MKTLLWLTPLLALCACGNAGTPGNVTQRPASATPAAIPERPQNAVPGTVDRAVVNDAIPPSPEGEWEVFSNGSIGMGNATVSGNTLSFAKAGSGTLVPRDGYFEVDWTKLTGEGVPCGTNTPAQVVQLTVKPKFLRASNMDVLRIEFFRSREAPDRGGDAGPCQIQSWARGAAE